MLITQESHPNLIEAIHCIEDDTGNKLKLPVKEVPDRWGPLLGNLELTIAQLSRKKRAPESEDLPPHVKPDTYLDSEFYTFCNGGFTEQLAIANRDFHHVQAYVFLADFFEDWTYTGDDAQNSPINIARRSRIEYIENLAAKKPELYTSELEAERNRLRVELK